MSNIAQLSRKKKQKLSSKEKVSLVSFEGLEFSADFDLEDIWLTQAQLAEMYKTTQENISMHITNIFNSGELLSDTCYKKSLLKDKNGVNRNIGQYNLDMILSLGYKINSVIAIKFRQFSNELWKQKLKESLNKNKRIEIYEKDRATGKIVRRKFTDIVKEIPTSQPNFIYKNVTDEIYKDPRILGMNAKKYREANNLDKRANVREHIAQNNREVYKVITKIESMAAELTIDYYVDGTSEARKFMRIATEQYFAQKAMMDSLNLTPKVRLTNNPPHD